MCSQICGKELTFSVNVMLLEEKQKNCIMDSVRLPCILPVFLLKSPIPFRKNDFYQAVKIFQSLCCSRSISVDDAGWDAKFCEINSCP